jgi:cell division protein FtsW (lipid II flippase)
VNGNRNWIMIGSFNMQPSEIVKLALVIWLGSVLARKQNVLHSWKELAVAVGPVAGAAIGFVLLGRDLGTAIIVTSIILGALFFAGVKLRHLAVVVGGMGVGAAIMAFATLSRQNRIQVWQDGCSSAADLMTDCWQTIHGWWALASGGIFGIGEELGLVGAALVLVLFALTAISFVRIIRSNPDPFAKITVSAVMVWIIGQAFVNIAVVLGVLPVLGVPLPLISAGGTALISSMVAIGVALSFARKSPADQASERAAQARAAQERAAHGRTVRGTAR